MELKAPAPSNVVPLQGAAPYRAPDGFKVVAIIACYNEADIIGAALEHLWRQGLQVAIIDHGSTDGTLDQVRRFEGKNLVHLERFPDESGFPPEEAGVYRWASLLRRKEQLAQELAGDWFIHHDADELRESPWPGLRLVDAVHLVHRCGYTAIDFEVLQFRPVTDGYRPGDDLAEAFPWFERADAHDRLQVKAWRNAGPVQLAPSAGHDVDFPGKRVFPVRFLLRHYPVRTQAQGERKVFGERRPRFVPEERERGWHVQYDAAAPGQSFLVSPERLVRYEADAERVRLLLHSRAVEDLERALEANRQDYSVVREALRTAEAERNRWRGENEQARAHLRTLEAELGRQKEALVAAADAAAHFEADAARLEAGLVETEARLTDAETRAAALEAQLREASREAEALRQSWSWKVTSPLRRALKAVRGF